jgi:predicted permease
MIGFLSGVNAALAGIAGLFFLRFWRETGDRFFASFAFAFWLFGINWVGLALTSPEYELRPLLYVVRLVAYVVLIAAIVEKNRVKQATR